MTFNKGGQELWSSFQQLVTIKKCKGLNDGLTVLQYFNNFVPPWLDGQAGGA